MEAVDRDLTDVGEQAGCRLIDDLRGVEQVRMVVDVVDVAAASLEVLVEQHVLEEVDVRLDAADAEFIEAAQHARDGLLGIVGMCGDLDEQGIVIRRDDRARVGRAGVEADARAAAAAVVVDLAGVRHEVVLRVFCRDAALDGHAVAGDVRLALDADLWIGEGIALGDEDLRLDDIDVRDGLGDRVLDLDARVDFDEVEVFLILVREELDGAGIDVADVLHDLQGRRADVLAKLLRQRPGRCHLDDLLVAALDGAVTLIEVDDIAVFIAHDLHFDVLRVQDALLDVDILVAKGALCLRARFLIGALEVFHAVDTAHAAAAAAVDGLDHDRQADALSEGLDLSEVLDGTVRARDHRDLCLLGLDARVDLVAEHLQVLDLRADEDDALFLAAPCQLCILGEEAVARMDGIDIVLLADADDVLDVEVGIDWLLALAHEIRLVGATAVQGQDIFFGIDGDRADAHLMAGAENADGNLAAVWHQDLVNGLHMDPP